MTKAERLKILKGILSYVDHLISHSAIEDLAERIDSAYSVDESNILKLAGKHLSAPYMYENGSEEFNEKLGNIIYFVKESLSQSDEILKVEVKEWLEKNA